MIIYLIAIFTGLIGFIILFNLRGIRTNRIVNINMAIIIFIASTRLSLLGIAGIYNNTDLEKLLNKFNFIYVFLVPFFYMYFKYLIQNQKKYQYKDLLHFVFPILLILQNRLSILELIVNTKLNFSYVYVFISYSISYNVLILYKLKKYIWSKKGTLEIAIKQNQLIRNWSVYFYCTMNLIIVRVFVSLFFETNSNNLITSQYGLWGGSILWTIVFTKILITPEILYGYSYLAKKSREFNSVTKKNSNWNLVSKIKINNIQDQQLKEKIDGNIEKYIHEIDEILINHNYFKNPDFAMKEFAIILNIPKSHLKYLFKYHSKVSFSDFKKIIRIQDAIGLIEQNYLTTNTMESLSKKVGFTSYNPFFTSFKDVVGKSPQEYIATLK